MKKKVLFFSVLLLITAAGGIIAQSGQSAENLVARTERLATRWETMAKNTSPLTKWTRISQKQIDSLEDDSETLSTDLAYAGRNGIVLTDSQNTRLSDATRRITNARSQIERNISRLERDY